MRHLLVQESKTSSGDIAKDMKDQNLTFLRILHGKLCDELVARLSELAETKIGRLNFHFIQLKLNRFFDEVERFGIFIQRYKFNEKRNYDISHKELPEQWSQHRSIHIPYRDILRAIALASTLIKKIDAFVLGPSAKYLWREMRKKRYELLNPPHAQYLLLPHLNLSKDARTKVIMEEMAGEFEVWSEMDATINGKQVRVPACKQWGAVIVGDRVIVLDAYPLQTLGEITVDAADQSTLPAKVKPVCEERVINAKYRVSEVSAQKILFVPVRRQHLLDDGIITDLLDFGINLNDEQRKALGEMFVGDVKEFTLTVTVLTGYEVI
jgi:hypothetical protein